MRDQVKSGIFLDFSIAQQPEGERIGAAASIVNTTGCDLEKDDSAPLWHPPTLLWATSTLTCEFVARLPISQVVVSHSTGATTTRKLAAGAALSPTIRYG